MRIRAGIDLQTWALTPLLGITKEEADPTSFSSPAAWWLVLCLGPVYITFRFKVCKA